MDVIIPSQSINLFGSAIVSLSKIGKDLYLEFDTVSGLDLRTLNDGKSVFSYFHFATSFFERCTMGPTNSTSRKRLSREDDTDDVLNLRIHFKALQGIVRHRKNVQCLRIFCKPDDSLLNFEYTLNHRDTLLTAVHRVKIGNDANSVSAVTQTEGASELTAHPKVLSKLLEPLCTQSNAAIIVRPNSLAASSFHYDESRKHVLVSETACSLDELVDFDFQTTRDTLDPDLPESVNQEVVLVIPVKCTSAFLHFCGTEMNVVDLSFHWGGKPLLLKSEADGVTAELVLATLDHSTLTSMRTMAHPQ